MGDGRYRSAYAPTPLSLTRVRADLADHPGLVGKANEHLVEAVLGALGQWMRAHPTKAFDLCVVLYRNAGQRSEWFHDARVPRRRARVIRLAGGPS